MYGLELSKTTTAIAKEKALDGGLVRAWFRDK
jgi:hypothetical protein